MGGEAVKVAIEGESGKVVVLKCVSDGPCTCITDTYAIHQIANIEKRVLLSGLTPPMKMCCLLSLNRYVPSFTPN